jgi:hypothetical protein
MKMHCPGVDPDFLRDEGLCDLGVAQVPFRRGSLKIRFHIIIARRLSVLAQLVQE